MRVFSSLFQSAANLRRTSNCNGNLIRLCGLGLGLWVCLLATGVSQADSARILKVLPHYVDQEGRHSLSPSLYERDAYQELLRNNPELRATLRFDINWKAKRVKTDKLFLRLELRSSGRELSQPLVLEQPVERGWFSRGWSSLQIDPEIYKTFGQLVAWRASLWVGDELLAEQKSFLW